ncbi:type III secretion system cytoplasmic ring protein SctQ [Alsobacter soli]|uniref:type III secretion system cytoplasmic ring protein SctQ n=1 Tax=Alsobacter soli TaxID=2109933 RepID=UPI00130487C2|nr:type III secretion system cytoplasmic ring protein SctQ [Alsobacter soli]
MEKLLVEKVSDSERRRAASLHKRWDTRGLPLPDGTGLIQVRPAVLDGAAGLAPPLLQLSGQWGAAPFSAWVSRATWLALLKAADPFISVSDLSREHWPSIANWLLASAFADQSVWIQEAVEEKAYRPDSSAFGFELPDLGAVVAIETQGSLSQALYELLRGWPHQEARETAYDLPMQVRCAVGYALVGLAELRALETGDVIEMDGPPEEHDEATLLLGSTHVCAAIASAHDWTATERPKPAAAARIGRIMLGEPIDDPETLDGSTDTIPIRLIFEVGRTTAPCGDLARIGPGYIFEVAGDPTLVDIMAEGRRIGSGRIVDLEGRRGIRVLSLFK